MSRLHYCLTKQCPSARTASLGLCYIDIIMQELRIAHLIENNDSRERTGLITVTKQAHTMHPFMNCTEHIWDYTVYLFLLTVSFSHPEYKAKALQFICSLSFFSQT